MWLMRFHFMWVVIDRLVDRQTHRQTGTHRLYKQDQFQKTGVHWLHAPINLKEG